MTNAHVVANQRFLTVQKDGDSKPYVARVLHVGHDVDLAIITVDDPGYFKGLPVLEFGTLPKLLSPVETVGYPRGGDQISITKGIVSRIGYRAYAHTSYHRHILVQVDSAINPGNSGGPVIQDRKVIGVAFQGFTNAQSTGYIIPTPVVNRFLQDIKDGTYDDSILDGLNIQGWKLINPDAREYYGLPDNSEGSYISYVNPASFLSEPTPEDGRLPLG